MSCAIRIEDRSGRRDRLSWYLYDFGNTAIEFTVALHLTQWLIADLGIASVTFGVAFAISSWCAGLSAPFAGSWADVKNTRRAWFTIASIVAAAAVGSLSILPTKGSSAARTLLITAGVGNLFFHLAGSFYNSGLRKASLGTNVGFTSGVGTMLSYLGGLAAIPTIAFVTSAGIWGLHLDRSRFFLPAAILFLVAAIPAFLSRALWSCKETTRTLLTNDWLRRPFRLVVTNGSSGSFFAGYFLLNSAIIGVSLYLPVLVRNIPSITSKQVDQVIAFAVLCAAAGALTAAILNRSSVSPRNVLVGSQFLWVLTLAMYRFLSPSLTITLLLVQAFFAGSIIPSVRAVFASMYSENDQAAAFGLFSFVQRISSGCGALLWPFLENGTSLQRIELTAMPAMAIIAALGIPLLARSMPATPVSKASALSS